MASLKYPKEWVGNIGGLQVRQSAQPFNDGDQLHVITGWYDGHHYFNGGSVIPFSDVEKLLDDGFRAELARIHIAARAKELRAGAEAVEKALAVVP